MAEITNPFSMNCIHCKLQLHFILENPVILHLQIEHFSFSHFILELYQYIKRGLWLVIMSLLKEPDTNNEPFPHHKTEKKCRPIGNCPLFRSITCVFLSLCWYVCTTQTKAPCYSCGRRGASSWKMVSFLIFKSTNYFHPYPITIFLCTSLVVLSKQYRKYDFSFPKVNQLRGKSDLAG